MTLPRELTSNLASTLKLIIIQVSSNLSILKELLPSKL